MCDPVSAAAVMGGASLLGTGVGVAGATQEGKFAEAQARERERLARMAAADALQRGAQDAGRSRMETGQLVAEQRVAYAASGVDPTVGTPADVIADTRALGELEARILENNAAREAWGLKRTADAYALEQEAIRKQTKLRVFGTILGGLGDGAYAAAGAMGSGGGGAGGNVPSAKYNVSMRKASGG